MGEVDGEVRTEAADGVCDEASAVFLVSKDPGFSGRCLPEQPQGHSAQTALTTSNAGFGVPLLCFIFAQTSYEIHHCHCYDLWFPLQ